MRVISCDSVRCSPAASRRRDSFNSLGTYAPMKTPLRLAICFRCLLVKSDRTTGASSDYFENASRYREHQSGPKTPTTVRGIKGHAIESKPVSRILYSDPRFEISNL